MADQPPPLTLRLPRQDNQLLEALVAELAQYGSQNPFRIKANRNRVAREAMLRGLRQMMTQLPAVVQKRVQSASPRRMLIQIRKNAIQGGFPTGGPYKRSGIPPLGDGEYEIVERWDGDWYWHDVLVLERLGRRK